MSAARDSRGGVSNGKGPTGRKGIAPLTSNHCMLLRAKRPNKPNRHCSVKLCTLQIKCPSVGVRTMRIARDSDGGQQKGSIEWEILKGAKKASLR